MRCDPKISPQQSRARIALSACINPSRVRVFVVGYRDSKKQYFLNYLPSQIQRKQFGWSVHDLLEA